MGYFAGTRAFSKNLRITCTRIPEYCESGNDGFLSPPVVNFFHELVHLSHHLEEPEAVSQRLKKLSAVFDNEEEEKTILTTNKFQRILGLPDRTTHHGPRNLHTAIIWAAQKGHILGIRELARHTCTVDPDLKREEDGATPLIIATMAGRVATVQALIDAGADPDLKYCGQTALGLLPSLHHPQRIITDLVQILLCASVERAAYRRQQRRHADEDSCQVM